MHSVHRGYRKIQNHLVYENLLPPPRRRLHPGPFQLQLCLLQIEGCCLLLHVQKRHLHDAWREENDVSPTK